MSDDIAPVTLSRALSETGRFLFQQNYRAVIVSLAWVITALPLVTIGPATLGAATAMKTIRETGTFDTDTVWRTVRRRFVSSTILGFLPLVFLAIALVYAHQYAMTGSTFAVMLAIPAVYAAAFLSLVLGYAFVEMARGEGPRNAFNAGRRWTATNPAEALGAGVLTTVICIAGVLTTIGFILLVPAALVTFYTELAESDERIENKSNRTTQKSTI